MISVTRATITNTCTAFLIISCIQETLTLLRDHHQFATSIVCTDPAEQAAAGKFAAIHCQYHRYD